MSRATTTRNGVAVPFSQVEPLPFAGFRAEVVRRVGEGARVASMFGVPEPHGLRLIAVLADDRASSLDVLSTAVTDAFPSLTPEVPQAQGSKYMELGWQKAAAK